MKRDVLFDKDGFSTLGMVVALLVTLSLLFSAARVYRVSSASADIQNVADAAALAAENEVAEFMIVVRVCDAVVLSLSLTGLASYGLGIVALCVPGAAGVGEKLIEMGGKVMDARDAFADKAANGLNQLQKALPFLAAANAASVASSNNGSSLGAEYLALAVLVPTEGEKIGIDSVEEADKLEKAVDEQADDLERAAKEAEEAAQEANEAKMRAFSRDCGDDPSHCMYERARALSSIEAADNPLYRSVDAWSFSVPLKRAQAYYASRLAEEAPEGASVEEQARSALRERFYRFASSEVGRGYVHETEGSFDAFFPQLPKNTDEMRLTTLYTETAYPVTMDSSGSPVMHAWAGCPQAGGATARGSIAQMEAGGYAMCPACGFTAASMGKVAAASTSIENGFEYHYVAVAQAAEDYQKARARLDPRTAAVKNRAQGLLDLCKQALEQVGGQRIDAAPPGRLGVVVMVANMRAAAASTGFESSFVQEGGMLGMRAAVSAATLVPDSADEGRSVLASLLDGFAEDGGSAVGAARMVLDCWSSLLRAYAEGQQAVETGVAQALDGLPLASASGLGTWAADALGSCVGALGLQPAKLDALKPVVVNTQHVAAADEGAFAVRFLAVKRQALAFPSTTTDLFSSVVDSVEDAVLEELADSNGTMRAGGYRVSRRRCFRAHHHHLATCGRGGGRRACRQSGQRPSLRLRRGHGGEGMGVKKRARKAWANQAGQMTVELAVAFPVVVAVAVIAMNALLFLSECAAFDRVARDAVRVHATSPAYGQGLEQSRAQVQAAIEEEQDRPYLQASVAVADGGAGRVTFTATLEFYPTLFGLGLKSHVFGVALPHLEHVASFTVDVYKPGVLM